MMDFYTPKPQDIEFAEMVTSVIRNGGHWGLPETGQIYQFDTEHKIMKLMNPETLTDDAAMISYERAKCVFAKIGWTVEALGNA